jgi:hypothetical protein
LWEEAKADPLPAERATISLDVFVAKIFADGSYSGCSPEQCPSLEKRKGTRPHLPSLFERERP